MNGGTAVATWWRRAERLAALIATIALLGAAPALAQGRDAPISAAASTGRCNTSVESLCRCFKPQGFAWPFVELTRHFVQMSLRVYRHVGAFGEVLSEQAISVLIGTPLPWALRITEVDIDVGRQAEPAMVREFLAPVPGQGLVELGRQLPRLPV